MNERIQVRAPCALRACRAPGGGAVRQLATERAGFGAASRTDGRLIARTRNTMDVQEKAAAIAAATGPGGRKAVAVPPRRSDRVRRKEKQAEKKRKKEEAAQASAAAERAAVEAAAKEAADKAAAERAAEKAARQQKAAMAPPQPRAKKPRTDASRGRPAAMSPVPSPSRLRAQTGTTFAFGWEGDGVIKHGRGGRARSEDSDQGYVSTYYRAFSRKLQRGGTEEVFKVGDSVQLYGAEQHADIQLAVLQDMFEDCLGTMWVRLNWYYLPVEVPEAALNDAEGGRADPHEVFRSNHLDDVEVSCIRAKVVVRDLTPEEQAERGAAGSRDQRAGAANWVTWRSYDVYKKRVRPTCDEGASDDDEEDSDADGMFSSESESDEEAPAHGTTDGEWNFAEARNHEALSKKHRGGRHAVVQQQRGNHNFILPRNGLDDAATSPVASQHSPSCSPLAGMETLSVFARAREVLRPGALPASMPCRERERAEVGDFLRQSLQLGGVGRGLYVSGAFQLSPLAVLAVAAPFDAEICPFQVCRALARQRLFTKSFGPCAKNGKKRKYHRCRPSASPLLVCPLRPWKVTRSVDVAQFRFVEINGMSLPDPAYAFSVLHEEVTGRYCAPQKAADNLDKYWSSYSEQRACTVLLLDEVDQLVTRKQNVLYKLLDWPTYPFARLIVVAIANTMDLPERLLPSKSRAFSYCGSVRI